MTVARHPLVLRKVVKLGRAVACIKSALVEQGLDRLDALLDRRSALDDTVLVGHFLLLDAWL
jgi:hypothetical protein